MHVTCTSSSSTELLISPSAFAGASAVVAAVLGTATPDPAEVVGALLARRLPAIPAARCASITQRGPRTGFLTVAASDDLAGRIDDVQYELGDGPCLQAVDGVVVDADAPTLRRRWPDVAARLTAETPVRGVLSQPLANDTALGSLNLYTERPGGFPPQALAAAADTAAACGLALVAVKERVRADNLMVALDSSRQIGAAIGIVMALTRCTYEQGFEMIRTASQRAQRKMRDIAEEIVLTGALPPR